jgi:copper chaperone
MLDETSTLNLAIDGMHCGSCALLIDDALSDLPGVRTSSTSTKNRLATVVHDQRISPTEIIGTIEELGYQAKPAPSNVA